MIERVGKEFPTLFICVQSRVSPAPLEPKDGASGGTGFSQPTAVFRLASLSKGWVTSVPSPSDTRGILCTTSPLLDVGQGSHWTAEKA